MTCASRAAFVGGPLHGTVREVTGRGAFRVPRLKTPIADYRPDDGAPGEVSVEVETYTPEPVAFFGRRAEVWVHESLRPVDGYRRAALADLLIGLFLSDFGKAALR